MPNGRIRSTDGNKGESDSMWEILGRRRGFGSPIEPHASADAGMRDAAQAVLKPRMNRFNQAAEQLANVGNRDRGRHRLPEVDHRRDGRSIGRDLQVLTNPPLRTTVHACWSGSMPVGSAGDSTLGGSGKRVPPTASSAYHGPG